VHFPSIEDAIFLRGRHAATYREDPLPDSYYLF